MTAALADAPVDGAPAHFWDRQGTHGPWWIPDESPGKLGDPEIWVDESAMDMYGRGDAAPAVTVTGGNYADKAGSWWGGAVIRFSAYPGKCETPVIYAVVSRQTSTANLNRPYYVLRWPD